MSNLGLYLGDVVFTRLEVCCVSTACVASLPIILIATTSLVSL